MDLAKSFRSQQVLKITQSRPGKCWNYLFYIWQHQTVLGMHRAVAAFRTVSYLNKELHILKPDYALLWNFICFYTVRFSTAVFKHRYKSYRTHTHTQPFNGPFSGTTRVSWYQQGKTNLGLTEARDSEWATMASAGPYARLHLASDRW